MKAFRESLKILSKLKNSVFLSITALITGSNMVVYLVSKQKTRVHQTILSPRKNYIGVRILKILKYYFALKEKV